MQESSNSGLIWTLSSKWLTLVSVRALKQESTFVKTKPQPSSYRWSGWPLRAWKIMCSLRNLMWYDYKFDLPRWSFTSLTCVSLSNDSALPLYFPSGHMVWLAGRFSLEGRYPIQTWTWWNFQSFWMMDYVLINQTTMPAMKICKNYDLHYNI